MKEDEATTKWCPFAKSRSVTIQLENGKTATGLVTDGDKALDMDGRPYINLNCIGSECMAWRWNDVQVLINIETKEQTPICGPISYDGSKFYTDDVPSNLHGYCGLAGRH